MRKKEEYIKQAFENYNVNKKLLCGISFEPLRGVDYSAQKVNTGAKGGYEKAFVSFLDKKRGIEKQVELVDRTLQYFQVEKFVDQGGKYDYILARWVKKRSNLNATLDCFICEKTGILWTKEIYRTAAAICDLFQLWD